MSSVSSPPKHIEQEVIATAHDLIRFRSTSDNPAEIVRCLEYIQDYFRDCPSLYITPYVFGNIPSLIVANKAQTRSFDILFNGHIDVVEAAASAYHPRIKNGKLYGRGAADMKASVATMMALMKYVAPSLPHTVGLMIVCDEEIGGFNGSAKLVEAGYKGKLVIIPDDMGDLALTTKEKGLLDFDVTFKGVRAHSCEPWKGSSAVDAFVTFATELRQLFPKPSREAWMTTCNIGPVIADHPRNQLAPVLKTSLDIRYTEEVSPSTLTKTIQRLAQKHHATAHVTLNGPAVATSLSHPLVQQFKKAGETILGRPMKTAVDHGASDARFFVAQKCPVILSKPPSQGLHGDNEYVEIAGLLIYYKILHYFCEHFHPHKDTSADITNSPRKGVAL